MIVSESILNAEHVLANMQKERTVQLPLYSLLI